MTPDNLIEAAALFHDTYERLAPSFGYETREETRTFDPASPNGQLMVETMRQLLPLLQGEGWREQAPRPYPHAVAGFKCSECLGFEGGALTIKTTGPQENGSGWFCFGEHECDHEIDDETGKGYWIVNVANSELIAIRDKLNEIFPPPSEPAEEER